ncbi:MAG: DNA mismatch repair protein MutS [Methanoregulaceae archaeon]|nr:DNA mismatch repair protein MutS [Methanoregulaceae archaeon]MCU0628370.1 DNA mismatch repair protein MutS [Methanoregulaceae archaeon]
MAKGEEGPAAKPGRMTPAMAQYWSIKEQHRDAILLFHIGDFYETFGGDAETVSRELEITLTSRSKDSGGQKIPLAGVPCHAVEGYIARLIAKGYKVALCDQVEDARNAKGIVRREVVRIITPGTVIDEEMIESSQARYLMAVAADPGSAQWGLAFLDITTGEFIVTTCPGELEKGSLISEIARYRPYECLMPESMMREIGDAVKRCGVVVTSTGESEPDLYSAKRVLVEHFKVQVLAGFGIESNPPVILAAAMVLCYAKETQRLDLSHVQQISFRQAGESCLIDGITLRNLEILESIRGRPGDATLLSILNLTKTPMGNRLLRSMLAAPLLSVSAINRRLDMVEYFSTRAGVRAGVREILGEVADIGRIAGRIACKNAGPRDLIALAHTLNLLPSLRSELDDPDLPVELAGSCGDLVDEEWIAPLIASAITDDPPAMIRHGGVIRQGYDPMLDELRFRTMSGKDWIIALQQRERENTGIKSLKVGYNSVFGYYIEVTKPNLALVPPYYQRKQTTASGERFTIPELKEQEALIAEAEDRLASLEQVLFASLIERLTEGIPSLQSVARGIAGIDTAAALAETAAINNYTRPVLDESLDILIREGRHPVVEQGMKGGFVPNDTVLSGNDSQILIITGANMAGKSTYMRAVALTAVMAQAGSFVPAAHARIGVVDRIFTRVGAFDDLASGQSTFMVEMIELANILNNMTARSLVILDEIGRGTSTLDGYCIARAVLEFLHGKAAFGPKTLFATHFHEIASAEQDLKRVRTYHFAVKDTGTDVVFLRKLIPGATDRSYGIHVASLAGLPGKVTARANGVMEEIIRGERTGGSRLQRYTQMLLVDVPPLMEHPVVSDLKKLDPDSLSPREALGKLYELKKRAGGKQG